MEAFIEKYFGVPDYMEPIHTDPYGMAIFRAIVALHAEGIPVHKGLALAEILRAMGMDPQTTDKRAIAKVKRVLGHYRWRAVTIREAPRRVRGIATPWFPYCSLNWRRPDKMLAEIEQTDAMMMGCLSGEKIPTPENWAGNDYLKNTPSNDYPAFMDMVDCPA
jgi:hypothetical protein